MTKVTVSEAEREDVEHGFEMIKDENHFLVEGIIYLKLAEDLQLKHGKGKKIKTFNAVSIAGGPPVYFEYDQPVVPVQKLSIEYIAGE